MRSRLRIKHPLLAIVLPQLAACLLLAGWWWLGGPGLPSLPDVSPAGILAIVAMMQGVLACLVAIALGTPRWWWVIHLGFAPLVAGALALHAPPSAYLLLFIAMALVFWRVDRSQVPLFLTNARTASALIELLPKDMLSVADLGCGNGAVLKQLAVQRPKCHFVGVEHAPLTWAWAYLNCWQQSNVEIRWARWETIDLRAYDVVYAFLSPAAMPGLWRQAKQQMRPGSLLISNSFDVPDAKPTQVLEVDDARNTRLLVYRA